MRGKKKWKWSCWATQYGRMKPTLTIPEAAGRIPIGVSTLRRYIRRKQITVIVLPGGDQRIDEADLDDFLNSRKIPRKK